MDDREHRTPEDNSEKKRRRSWLRGLLYAFAGLLVLAVGLLVLAGTGPVLRLAMPKVEQAVAASGDHLAAAGLRGSLWTGLTIDSLSFALPATGLAIDGQGLALRWSPLALLRGAVRVDRLAAAELAVSLPRNAAPAEPEKPPSRPLVLPLELRLDQLDLPKVYITEPKSGRIFSYSVTAAGEARKRAAELSLTLTPRQEESDRLRVDLLFHADRRELRAEIDGRFDRRGLVMTLAGLPKEKATDLGISLKGEGPAADWRGRLSVAATDLAELAADVGLQQDGGQLGFSLAGNAETLGRLASELPPELRGASKIGLTGRYEFEPKKLNLARLELAKPDLLALSASGELDLAASRLDATLSAKIDAAAGGLTGGAVKWQELTLAGTAKGNPAMPDLDLTAHGRSVAAPGFSTKDLSLSLQSVANGEILAVRAKAMTSGDDWPDYLRGVLGRRLDLDIAADVAQDFGTFSIERLDAKSADLRLSGRGSVTAHGAVSHADLALDSSDLAAFSALARLKLQGAGRLALQDTNWDPAHGGRAGVEFTARDFGLGQADLDRLTGREPKLAGQLELSPRYDFAVRLDRVDLGGTSGSASADFTESFGRMAIAGDLAVLPAAVPPNIGVTVPQNARLTVRLDGPTSAPAGEIGITAPQVETGGGNFEQVRLNSTLQWSDKVLSLVNRGDFILNGGSYRLTGDVSLPPDRLQLSRLALQGEGLALSGELSMPGYGLPLKGTMNLSRLDAKLVQPWVPPLAAGRLTGKIDFQAEEKRQRLKVDLAAEGIRLAGGGAKQNGLDRLALRGSVADAFGQPAFELQLTGARVAYAGATLDRLQAGLHGPLKGLRATVETAGQLQAKEALPLELSATADLALAEELNVSVGKLAGTLGKERIALTRPLRLARTATGTLEGAAALSIGTRGAKGTEVRAARIEGSLHLTPGRELTARAEVTGLALAPWDEMFFRRGLTGEVSVTADLSEQAGQAARGQLQGGISDIRLSSATPAAQAAGIETAGAQKPSQMPPLALQLKASLGDGHLEGDLSLAGASEQILTAQATLPLTVKVLDGQYDLDRRAPLALRANVDGEIARFWPYVPLPDHSLSGRLKLAAALAGSLDDPKLSGTVALTEGRYEHLQFGTLLRNLKITGKLDSHGVHLDEIAADDGGKGRLSGTAQFEIGHEPLVTYRATLTMRDMAVTRMDELKIRGNVDLSVSGNEREAAIDGALKVERGDIDLGVALPASVPQLKVENLGSPQWQKSRANTNRAAMEEREKKAEGFAANLKVSVDIPGQLFVRGKGLDSEWGGKIDINGPAAEPHLVGQLQARRGQLDLIGKTFVIRDSQISFLGGNPPDPELNIIGVYTAGDLTVTATLTGTAKKSQLTLTSDPQLPQDEVLSRILFGKSQSKLSPYEAVQLASVAADLTGKSSFDILGSFRKILRLDVLRVEGGQQGPQVEVGKYLTQGVYVGTKQGTTAGSTGVEVEVDLTPHIKATSETNEIDNKAGIQFKWDY